MTRAVQAAISFGEAADKITILTIKSERLTDAAKLENVRKELGLLGAAFKAQAPQVPGFDDLFAQLKAVNEKLWVIEDDIRGCDARGDFGPDFIALARAVYKTNDRRAQIKRAIDALLGSEIREEKSYRG